MTWSELPDFRNQELLVLLPYKDYFVKGQRVFLDSLKWTGERDNLLSIEHTDYEESADLGFFVSVLPDSSNHLLVSSLDSGNVTGIYILEPKRRVVIGFDPGCASNLSSSLDIALGKRYLA